MEYYYCWLPGGNREEFPELDNELFRRGIDAYVLDFPDGSSRVYRITCEDLHKLPKDKTGHYLGNDNSGHSIYKREETPYNTFMSRYTNGDPEWVPLVIAKLRNVGKDNPNDSSAY